MDIESIQRTGSELLVRFSDEQSAGRMEAALNAAYPELVVPEPKPAPVGPEPESVSEPVANQSVRTSIKSEWKDGMVVEAFIENTSEREQELSVQMRLGATLEALWGGHWQLVGDFYEVRSIKPVQPGETWEITFKALGSDHSILLLGGDMPEPVSQAEPMAAPVHDAGGDIRGREADTPLPEPTSFDAPMPGGKLLYSPDIDPSLSAKDNILDNLGGVYDGGWDWENIEVVDNPDGPCLRTHMGQGLYVGDKGKRRGGGFDTRTMKATHAVLEYDLRLRPDFDPVKGGKLPGLMAGDSPSGHKEALNGMTARMMWRRNAEGELYLYFPDMKQSHGDSIGRGNFHFDTSGEWQRVKQEVRLNDVGKSNGFIKVWYDNELVIEVTDLRLRTKDSVLLEGIMHTIFFGGGDRSWAATRDEWIDTRNFKIYTP